MRVTRRWHSLLGLGLLACTAAGVAHATGVDSFLKQSRGAGDPNDIDEWRKGESRGPLKPYPIAAPGATNPSGNLSQFGGGGNTSFGSPDLGMPFAVWKQKMEGQRPAVDKAAQDVLSARYKLECKTDPAITMSRGKLQAIGPAAKLPNGVASFEDLAAQSADTIKSKNLFPWLPLDHPIQSTGHMVFPPTWTRIHPEQIRFDVSFDLPECYLPEYPPALFLTTHPELGDVARGVEIGYGNYFDMFNGIITPEQLDGLRLLVTPFPTTWFNVTHHRVTDEPSQGVSCFRVT